MDQDIEKTVLSLCQKADGKDTTSIQALQFTQAALNAAHAKQVLALKEGH